MANQKAIACLLVITGILLLAIVNQLGWLLLMIPVALLIACTLASPAIPAKQRGERI
jgi:hypothetical protein